jgi:hypothetical protein
VKRLALALALALAPALAAAQSACPGVVSASAAASVPAGSSIDLVLANDGPSQVRAREAVRDALRRGGFAVSERPAFTLALRGRAGIEGGAPFSIEPRDMFHESDDFAWLGGSPRVVRREPVAPRAVRINAVVELREAATRRVVWTAVISCERRATDEALARHLANAVVPLIGRTVAGQPL